VDEHDQPPGAAGGEGPSVPAEGFGCAVPVRDGEGPAELRVDPAGAAGVGASGAALRGRPAGGAGGDRGMAAYDAGRLATGPAFRAECGGLGRGGERVGRLPACALPTLRGVLLST